RGGGAMCVAVAGGSQRSSPGRSSDRTASRWRRSTTTACCVRSRTHSACLRSADRLPRGRSWASGGGRKLGLVTISLARGIPAPECLPVEELADCAQAALERDGRTVLSYGPVGGYAPLREWVAARHGVEPERVLLTNGSLQGFVFLAQLLARDGAR